MMYAPNVFTLDVAGMMAGADLGKEILSYQAMYLTYSTDFLHRLC